MSRRQVQIHSSVVVFPKKTYSSSNLEHFEIADGSRMIMSLVVTAIDPATTVTLTAKDFMSVDMAPELKESLSLSAVGSVKKVISDFHNLFDFELTVAGGTAEVLFGITVHDNALATTIENAEIDVHLSHVDAPDREYDSTRIGDGTDLLEVNPDGSLNVNIVNTSVVPEVVVLTPGENLLVAANTPETVTTYTAPIGKITYLQRITGTGDNTAKYWVEIGGDVKETKRTNFGGNLNVDFEYAAYSENGYKVDPGTVVRLRVEHYRPFDGSFNGTIQTLEIG